MVSRFEQGHHCIPRRVTGAAWSSWAWEWAWPAAPACPPAPRAAPITRTGLGRRSQRPAWHRKWSLRPGEIRRWRIRVFFHDLPCFSMMFQGFPMVSQCCSTILQMIYSSTIEMFAEKNQRLGWCRGSRLRKKTVCRKPWRQKVLNDFHKIGDLTKQTWGCNGISIGIHRIDIWICGSENIQIYLWFALCFTSFLTIIFLGIRFSENPYLSIYLILSYLSNLSIYLSIYLYICIYIYIYR